MSVRLEWSEADLTDVSVLRRGDEAGDGGGVTHDLCAVVGSQAIEGTYIELMFLFARAVASLQLDVSDVDPDLLVPRAARNLVLMMSEQHEDENHDGEACMSSRCGLAAYLCHSLGLEPIHLALVAEQLHEYNDHHNHVNGGGN